MRAAKYSPSINIQSRCSVQPFPWSGESHEFVLRLSGLILIVGAKRWCAGGLIISMPSGYAALTVVMLPNIFPAL
jgi:hypothetical protein